MAFRLAKLAALIRGAIASSADCMPLFLPGLSCETKQRRLDALLKDAHGPAVTHRYMELEETLLIELPRLRSVLKRFRLGDFGEDWVSPHYSIVPAELREYTFMFVMLSLADDGRLYLPLLLAPVHDLKEALDKTVILASQASTFDELSPEEWLRGPCESVLGLQSRTGRTKSAARENWRREVCSGSKSFIQVVSELEPSVLSTFLGRGFDEEFDKEARDIYFTHLFFLETPKWRQPSIHKTLDLVREVPMEVSPWMRTTCMQGLGRQAYLCDATLAALDELKTLVPNLDRQLVSFRTQASAIVEAVKHELPIFASSKRSLGFSLDFGYMDIDESVHWLLEVLNSQPQQLSWPALERVLKATTVEDRTLEIRAMHAPEILELTDRTKTLCMSFFTLGTCQNLRKEFLKIPRSVVRLIVAGEIPITPGSVMRLLKIRGTGLSGFLDRNRLPIAAPEEDECGVCSEKYQAHNCAFLERFPVTICQPAGESSGHSFCHRCLELIHRSTGRIRCPVCRRPVFSE